MLSMRTYRWLKWAAVAVASVTGSILAPMLIWLDALMKGDAHAIYMFAMQTAEPVALVAAATVTFLGARRCVERGPRAADEGAGIGALSAAAMFGAALWVNDVDGWTIAAAALLPIVGCLGGCVARDVGANRDLIAHARRALPELRYPGPSRQPRRGTKSVLRQY